MPIVGEIYSELISDHNIFVYLAFAAVPFTAWVIYRTRFGLRLRAVGENPAAVDTAGISVTWLRYRAVIICGVFCGLAGACWSGERISKRADSSSSNSTDLFRLSTVSSRDSLLRSRISSTTVRSAEVALVGTPARTADLGGPSVSISGETLTSATSWPPW